MEKKFEQLQLEHVASETNLQCQLANKEELIISLREQLQQLTDTLHLSENKQCQNCSHFKQQVEDLKLKFSPLETRIALMEKENKKLTDEIKKLWEDQASSSVIVTSEKNQLQSELTKHLRELERLKAHLLQVCSLLLKSLIKNIL